MTEARKAQALVHAARHSDGMDCANSAHFLEWVVHDSAILHPSGFADSGEAMQRAMTSATTPHARLFEPWPCGTSQAFRSVQTPVGPPTRCLSPDRDPVLWMDACL